MTPAPGCSGGGNPPNGSLTLISGNGATAGFTNSTSVQATLAVGDDNCLDVMAKLSNNGTTWTDIVLMCTKQCAEVPPRAGMGVLSPTTVAWTIPGGNGSKTIYLKFTDGNGGDSAVYTKTITLDQTDPTMPGSFGLASCTKHGNDRTFTFTWTASSDTNFLGHRLYRSIDSGGYTAIGTVAGNSISDTVNQNLEQVRYYAVGYDSAGNESNDTEILTFGRKVCPS
jgi:hypothetical protein